MKKSMLLSAFLLLLSLPALQAQFGIGLTTGGDFYQRYTNPENPADSGALRSAGNVFLNSSIGPKIWIGSRRFSLSLEAQVVYGATAFSIREYKGMGAVAFPMMAHLNFNGLSGFGKKSFGTGFALGGGIQYSRTELYGTTRDYVDLERRLFPTYVAEVQVGGGGGGIMIQLYARYGLGFDEDWNLNGGRSFNVGLTSSFNITELRKKPKSSQPEEGGIDAKPKIQQ